LSSNAHELTGQLFGVRGRELLLFSQPRPVARTLVSAGTVWDEAALAQAINREFGAGLTDLAPLVAFGASPRATLALSEASRALAFLRGRGYVVPEDVKEIAHDVLRHRILLTYEAEAENVTTENVIDRVLERVEVP